MNDSLATEVVPATTLVSFIARAAQDPTFDVGKFRELLVMQREERLAHELRAFNQAMAECQVEMEPIARDAVNPITRSTYAKFETIYAAMKPVYTRHGFSVRFGSAQCPREGWIRVVCTVSHTGGYSETNYLDAPPDDVGLKGQSSKTGVQSVGSSVSYLRRYLLVMVFNIVTADDDDGQAPRPGYRPPPPPRPKPTLTPEQFLDSIEMALNEAQTIEQINKVLDSERVQKARERATGQIKERLEGMIEQASERLSALLDDQAEAAIDDDIPFPDRKPSGAPTQPTS